MAVRKTESEGRTFDSVQLHAGFIRGLSQLIYPFGCSYSQFTRCWYIHLRFVNGSGRAFGQFGPIFVREIQRTRTYDPKYSKGCFYFLQTPVCSTSMPSSWHPDVMWPESGWHLGRGKHSQCLHIQQMTQAQDSELGKWGPVGPPRKKEKLLICCILFGPWTNWSKITPNEARCFFSY